MLTFVVQARKKPYVVHIDLRQTIFPMSIFAHKIQISLESISGIFTD